MNDKENIGIKALHYLLILSFIPQVLQDYHVGRHVTHIFVSGILPWRPVTQARMTLFLFELINTLIATVAYIYVTGILPLEPVTQVRMTVFLFEVTNTLIATSSISMWRVYFRVNRHPNMGDGSSLRVN